MRVKIIKITAKYLLLVIVFYFVIGSFFHLVLFPEQKPVVTNWFRPGQVFYSKTEGFRQTVVKQEDGYVHCTLEMEPYAAGPPKHIHTGFDETFELENGELTVWVNGETRKILPGEVLHIPKGTPHKPYNATPDTIRLKGAFSFPEKFAFNLLQVYGIMDNEPGFREKPGIFFHMALFQANGFDSYIADGPPVFIQKILSLIMTPALRIFGYKSYYKKYDPFIATK